MGLLADIYISSRYKDCSNGGLSSTHKEVCLVNVDGPFKPSKDAPAAMLVRGAYEGIAIVVPVDRPEGLNGPMMGGAYVATSDSRFSAAVRKITGNEFYGAVPLHDRFEDWR